MKRLRKQRRGAAAVEFALTAPIALLLLFGFIESARVHMIMNSAETAAYEGARRAILPGATAAQAQTATTNHLSASLVHTATASVVPSTITAATKEVTVTATVPVTANLWFTPFFFQDITINRSCTLARELSGD